MHGPSAGRARACAGLAPDRPLSPSCRGRGSSLEKKQCRNRELVVPPLSNCKQSGADDHRRKKHPTARASKGRGGLAFLVVKIDGRARRGGGHPSPPPPPPPPPPRAGPRPQGAR